MKIIKIFICSLCFSFLFENAHAALDAGKLKELKNSSVYITVESGESGQSGSGFLIHKDGEKGIVATNAHVVDLNIGHQKVNVFFNSGTQKEKRYPAEIIALNHVDDLAFLEIASENLPEVIALTDEMDVIETEELYMIGFPFGSQFSTNRENPLVTISKGIISSKRLDINDEIFLLQIDGDINPGNSGGPIVNGDGQLVGVSVATVKKTNIGFAIPKFKVVNMLNGSLGNIRIEGLGKGAKFVADVFDPFGKIISASVIFSDVEEKNTLDYLGKDNKWREIDGQILSLNLNKIDKMYSVNISSLPSSEKKYIAQVVINYANNMTFYQSPFLIEKANLDISLNGPHVWDRSDDSVFSQTDENSEQLNDKDTDDLVFSMLINSGLDAFIKNMSKEPESFFEDVNDSDDEENSEKIEFVDKFVEIIKKDWNEDEIVDHYVTSFKNNMELSDLRNINSLFDTPDFHEVHMSINDVDSIDIDALKKFKDKYENKEETDKEKEKLIREINEERNLPAVIVTTFEVTNRSVMTVMNNIAPKNRRKKQKYVEQDVAGLTRPYQRAWDDIIYYHMLENYQDVSIKDLKSYLKLIKTDPFQHYITQENEIFSTLLTKHMLSVEKDVETLMSELQKEQLGLEDVPTLEGLSEEDIVQTLFDTYGKDKVIELLLKKSAGEITVDQKGRVTTYYGRPRKDFVTVRTMLTDLKRMDLKPTQFAQLLDEEAVQKRYSDLNKKKWRNAVPYSQ